MSNLMFTISVDFWLIQSSIFRRRSCNGKWCWFCSQISRATESSCLQHIFAQWFFSNISWIVDGATWIPGMTILNNGLPKMIWRWNKNEYVLGKNNIFKFNIILTGFKSCNENDLSSWCCIGVRKSPWTIWFSSTVWIWLLAQNSKNYSGMKETKLVQFFTLNFDNTALSNHLSSFLMRLGRHSG